MMQTYKEGCIMSTPMTWLVIFPNLQVPDLMIQIPSFLCLAKQTPKLGQSAPIFFAIKTTLCCKGRLCPSFLRTGERSIAIEFNKIKYIPFLLFHLSTFLKNKLWFGYVAGYVLLSTMNTALLIHHQGD